MADELLDLVNELDEVTGQAMRSVVHKEGLWHRGVHVFLFNEQGEMLIQKRSADRKNSPSLLDCSVSEHVKAGESYLEAAVRGLQEEMGVEGVDLTLRGKIKMEYGVNDNEISVIYEGRLRGKSVQFDPVEIAEIMFMSLDEVKIQIIRYPEKYCYWFIQLMKWYFGDTANLRELRP